MNKKSNIIVGLVAVGVIGLGVLGVTLVSKTGKGKEVPVKVQASEKVVPAEQVEQKAVKMEEGSSSFVASKQGKKYFPADCGSAKTIKEENRVYFETEVEAQQAGYERTLSCK